MSIPLPSLWRHEYNDTRPIGSKFVWVTAECVFSDDYFRMKLQWKSVSEEQERRNSRLRDYRSQIGEKHHLIVGRRKKLFMSHFFFAEKDVNRTDRTNWFYDGVENPGLGLLHDILMTYCMYDFDLGETCTCWLHPLCPVSLR